VAINIYTMPSINDFLKGFTSGLPGMKDYRHASQLYIADNHKLMPKQKFLFHVYFDINEGSMSAGGSGTTEFSKEEKYELNMLVKACDLPKYDFNVEEKNQYNKKTYVGTRIGYQPIVISFHDDHADTVNAFWKKYYEYEIADSKGLSIEDYVLNGRDDMYDNSKSRVANRYGMDTPKARRQPYLRSIQIFTLQKQRFTSFTLVNPRIGSFSHDNLDAGDGAGILQNQMQVFYETVVYDTGIVKEMGKFGFAKLHYDKEPSPLTVFGGTGNSIFGPGGIIDGVGSVLSAARSGNYLGAILSGINTANKIKKKKAKDVKQELKGIIKEEVVKTATGGTGSQVGDIIVGTGLATAIAVDTALSDDEKKNATIINNTPNSIDFLTADEVFRLVSNNTTVRDQVAAGIYYKDIGSRKGLSVAQSDVEFNTQTDSVKTVYRTKVTTDIRKLVNKGYIKVGRDNQNVTVATEKASITT